jgi:hypothetical protein
VLARQTLCYLCHTAALCALVTFQIRPHICFLPRQPGLQASSICFLCSWDDRYTAARPAFLLRWDLTNIFAWGWPQTVILPNLSLPSSYSYRCELLVLSQFYISFAKIILFDETVKWNCILSFIFRLFLVRI